jgi:hypothetical protein
MFPTFDQATGSLALSGVLAGHACSIANIELVADTDFAVGANDTITTQNFVTAIAAHATLSKLVIPEADGTDANLTSIVSGSVGNSIELSSSQASIVVTPMSGGDGDATDQTANTDAELLRACAAASEWIRGRIGWGILSDSYTEYFDWSVNAYPRLTTKRFTLAQPLVTAISSVTLNEEAISESSSGSAGWKLWNGRLELVRWQELDYNSDVIDDRHNLTVVYTAGYDDLPDDLKNAVFEVAADMFRRYSRIGQRAWSTGGNNETYYVDPVLPSVQAVIETYRLPEMEIL